MVCLLVQDIVPVSDDVQKDSPAGQSKPVNVAVDNPTGATVSDTFNI